MRKQKPVEEKVLIALGTPHPLEQLTCPRWPLGMSDGGTVRTLDRIGLREGVFPSMRRIFGSCLNTAPAHKGPNLDAIESEDERSRMVIPLIRSYIAFGILLSLEGKPSLGWTLTSRNSSQSFNRPLIRLILKARFKG